MARKTDANQTVLGEIGKGWAGLAKHLSSSLEETPFPGRLTAGERVLFLDSRRQVLICEPVRACRERRIRTLNRANAPQNHVNDVLVDIMSQ